MSARGSCMCGGVRYEVAGELRDVWNCHCHRCRQFTGHHMAATAASPDAVAFESDDTLAWYSPEPTVQYGFCNRCGSSLFWRTIARPESISICAGTLHQPTTLCTTTAWWVAEHADYHTPTTHLTDHEYDG